MTSQQKACREAQKALRRAERSGVWIAESTFLRLNETFQDACCDDKKAA